MLRAAGFSRSFLIGETGAPLELRERTGMATRGGAQVLVSIHHDSVQPRYLRTSTLQGRVREYTTHAREFSLFVSARNSFFAASKRPRGLHRVGAGSRHLSAGNFGLRCSRRAADPGLVLGVELGLDGLELAPLEIGDRQAPPARGGADHGAEHQLQDRLLAECVGHDLEPPAFFQE
jgi:hypothetical protein